MLVNKFHVKSKPDRNQSKPTVCTGCFSVQIRFMDTFASKYFINYCLHKKQDRGILSLKSDLKLHFCAVWAVMAVIRTFLQYCKNILLLRQVFNICMGKKMSTFCTNVRNLKVDEHKSEKSDNFSSTYFFLDFQGCQSRPKFEFECKNRSLLRMSLLYLLCDCLHGQI